MDTAHAQLGTVSDDESEKGSGSGSQENASANAGAAAAGAVPDIANMHNMRQLTKDMSGLNANLGASVRKRCASCTPRLAVFCVESAFTLHVLGLCVAVHAYIF